MAEHAATDEDLTAIRGILLQWREEGTANPLLPTDVDVDGDGIIDAYGLDDNDNVIVVSGVPLEDTVYLSTGGEWNEDA